MHSGCIQMFFSTAAYGIAESDELNQLTWELKFAEEYTAHWTRLIHSRCSFQWAPDQILVHQCPEFAHRMVLLLLCLDCWPPLFLHVSSNRPTRSTNIISPGNAHQIVIYIYYNIYIYTPLYSLRWRQSVTIISISHILHSFLGLL